MLMSNVHCGLQIPEDPEKNTFRTVLVSGNYYYYHYLCDGVDDRGWGCGYRTLQTLCSWLNNKISVSKRVPSIYEIQEVLVSLEDKDKTFLGSRQWIGSFEVCLVIDKLYDIPCKILHVNKGDDLKLIIEKICEHFDNVGSPIMMGGNIDCSSKGVMGIHIGNNDTYLLVVDPHYVGKEQTPDFLQKKCWVKWQPLSDFHSSSFYNLCLPQVKK